MEFGYYITSWQNQVNFCKVASFNLKLVKTNIPRYVIKHIRTMISDSAVAIHSISKPPDFLSYSIYSDKGMSRVC